MKVMECDSKMSECLFDACKRMTKFIVYPDTKYRQGLKKKMVKASSSDKSGIIGRPISIPKTNTSTSNKRNAPLKKMLHCIVHIFHLSMIPVTSPNNHI